MRNARRRGCAAWQRPKDGSWAQHQQEKRTRNISGRPSLLRVEVVGGGGSPPLVREVRGRGIRRSCEARTPMWGAMSLCRWCIVVFSWEASSIGQDSFYVPGHHGLQRCRLFSGTVKRLFARRAPPVTKYILRQMISLELLSSNEQTRNDCGK